MTLETDVLVVGAGIIGCSVARALASRGLRVVVVDARGTSLGATQASAGMLAPYIEAHEGGVLFDLTIRSLDLYDAWIAAVQRESGVDVEYMRSGSLEIALDEEGLARLQALGARSGSKGGLRWLDRDGARTLEPALAPRALGALSAPSHGYVAAQPLTLALERAAAAYGATFHPGTTVVGIEPSASSVEVVSQDGQRMRAARVVVAAGSWTQTLEGDADAAAADVRPVRGQLLRLRWRGRPLTQVIWGPSCYLVPWRDGTVLVGATMEDVGFEERTTVGGIAGLFEAVTALLPEAADATFLEARAGLRPATSDGLPVIGFSERSDRIVYASGHYRNGILLAPLTGELVSGLVLGGPSDPALGALTPARLRRPART